MKKTTLLLVLLAGFQLAFAQQTDTIAEVSDTIVHQDEEIPPPIDSLVFYESFADNENFWDTLTNENVSQIITGDNYLFENKKPNTVSISYITLLIDHDKDFTIETNIEKLKGVNNNGYGLIFGKTSSPDDYNFLISGNGQYNVIRWEKGKIKHLIPWTSNNVVKQNDSITNTLTVKKQNHTLKYFINGKYLGRVAFEPDTGMTEMKLGYVINRNMKLSIDDLKVYETTPDYPYLSDTVNLVIDNLTFTEPSNNGVLDPEETGEISFDLINYGKANARDIEIKLSSLISAEGLVYKPLIHIDTIAPSQKREISIPVSAASHIGNYRRKFKIDVAEISDVDAASAFILFNTGTNIETRDEKSTAMDQAYRECAAMCCGTGIVAILYIILYEL